jgi:hypothetical protein
MPQGAYAVVRDVPASWSVYLETAGDLARRPPKGLLAHAAGPTDEGLRIVTLWSSRLDWERSGDRSHASTTREFEVRDLYLAEAPRLTNSGSGTGNPEEPPALAAAENVNTIPAPRVGGFS